HPEPLVEYPCLHPHCAIAPQVVVHRSGCDLPGRRKLSTPPVPSRDGVRADVLRPRAHHITGAYPRGRTHGRTCRFRLTHMAQQASAPSQRRLGRNAFVVDAIVAGALLLAVGLLSVATATAFGRGSLAAVVGALTSLGMPVALAWRRTR